MTKTFEFVSKAAKRAFKSLPRDIQIQFGHDLNAVCQNLDPYSTFKHISSSVGPGAIELIENGSPAYRTVYCAKFQDTVYILHAFEKTTNGVDKPNMDIAKDRYKLMKEQVQEAEKNKKAEQKQPPNKRSSKGRKKKKR